jgi:hypothetical protein
MSNWTQSQTIAPPRTITVRYANQQGQQRSVALTSTDTGETVTTFFLFTYTNEQGATEDSEVAVRKIERKRTTQASVNGALVAGKLAVGQGLPSGDAITEIETTYEYDTSTSGPVLARERAETRISLSEFAGGLAVPSYEFYTPGTSLVTSTIRETVNFTATLADGRQATRTETSTWIAYGLTQEGQQSFAEQMKQTQDVATDPSGGGAYISESVLSMLPLVFQGTEVRAEIGRFPPPTKPPEHEIARDIINAGTGDRKTATGRVNYGNNNDTTKTKTFNMPFAPDDYYQWVT